MIEDERIKHLATLRDFITRRAIATEDYAKCLHAVAALETLPQIEVKKVAKTTWEACVIDQPGTPIAGHGKTWQEALGSYVVNNPGLFGIKSTSRGVEGIKVLNKDGSPYKFKGEPSRED